jgi:hypothetical protein
MTRPDAASAPDNVFDAIAQLLEPGQREYFYQRMLQFRHLRPEDELLRLVEAIGFLALLIREAPKAVAIERDQIANTLATSLVSIQAVAQSWRAYQMQLDDRLARLPAEIANGISPEAIAQAITESLRQQFVQSGLPATAEALTVVARQIKQTSGDVQRSAVQLAACPSVAEHANRTIDELSASLARATDTARWAAADIAQHVRLDYYRSVSLLCAAACVLGVILGFVLQSWRASRSSAAPQTIEAPIEVTPPPSSPSTSPKTRTRRDSSRSQTVPRVP